MRELTLILTDLYLAPELRESLVASMEPAVSRLRDQIAVRPGELFRIADAVSDKLQFVAGLGKNLLAETYDKLNVASFGKRLSAGICDELMVFEN